MVGNESCLVAACLDNFPHLHTLVCCSRAVHTPRNGMAPAAAVLTLAACLDASTACAACRACTSWHPPVQVWGGRALEALPSTSAASRGFGWEQVTSSAGISPSISASWKVLPALPAECQSVAAGTVHTQSMAGGLTTHAGWHPPQAPAGWRC